MCVSKARASFLFVLVTVLAFLLLSFAPVQAQTFEPVPSLAFTKPFGGIDPLPQTLTIAAVGTGFNFTVVASTNNGGSWLSVATGAGCGVCATPHAVTVVVTALITLPAATYTGQVVVTSQTGSKVLTIPVSLTVVAAAGTFLDNMPGQLNFSLKTGNTSLTSRVIQVRNGGTGTLNWTLTKSTSDLGNWLTVSATSGTAPSVVTIGITVSHLPSGGLVAGSFVGQLVFSSASSTTTVPIVVVVGDNILSQINGVSFTKVFGGIDPLPQTLTVASTGTTFNFTATAFTATGGDWLTVATGGSCGVCALPQTVTATIGAVVTLPVGTYTGEILITSQTGNMAITVPVTLTVAAADTTFLDNVAGQMSFALKTSGATITNQDVQIRNAGTGTLNWTASASTSDASPWLTISAPSGTAPSYVTVHITVANLPSGGLIAGTFIGQLVFMTAGSSVTVPVSVVVGANVLTQVNGIAFTKLFGGADPLPQTITVASTGTTFNAVAVAYTATGGSWLSVSTGGSCGVCALPQTLKATVAASPTLPVGIYTGQIVVTAQGGGMAITVPVTLTIAAAGTPFFDNVPGQMSFTLLTGSGKTPPAQSIQLRNAGAGILDWTLAVSTSDGGNWLNASALSGNAPSSVSISVSPQNLPNIGLIAGSFVGELVFRSSTGSSVTVQVSMVVGANVFNQTNGIAFTMPFGGPNPLHRP